MMILLNDANAVESEYAIANEAIDKINSALRNGKKSIKSLISSCLVSAKHDKYFE